MVKPGYKTSEFWFTMVSFLFSGLYLIGLFGEDTQQKEDLIRDVSHGVESIILISGQLVVLYKYINSRNQLKQVWWSNASPEERKEVSRKKTKVTKNVKSRPTKSTSAKK
jgi:hypothetical protein